MINNPLNKFLKVFLISALVIFTSAAGFPEKLPDWKEITEYRPEQLKFRETTFEDYKKKVPHSEVYNMGNNVKIVNTKLENNDTYEEVNVGFQNGKLDWLEFVLRKEIEVNEMLVLYGFPHKLETDYSDVMDYYHYDNFNFATDKQHIKVKNFSIFNLTLVLPEIPVTEEVEKKEVPKKKFFELFGMLYPGITIEREFIKFFPDLLPYMEEEFDTNSSYTLIRELEDAGYYYKKATVKFENGILSWISLTPNNLSFDEFINSNKAQYQIEPLNSKYEFYKFNDYTLLVDKSTNDIVDIGVFKQDKRF